MSQNSEILAHLKSGKQLTQLQALKLFGTMRLAARVDELRCKGHKVLTEMITVGNGVRVARYKLVK